MLKLKLHTKPINQFTDIDKYLLIPKKFWDEFEVGEIELKLNGQNVKTRIYDIYCECVKPKHNHRVLDLRDFTEKLNLEESKEITIEK